MSRNNNNFGATFRAQHSVSVYDRRRRAVNHTAHENAPRNIRTSPNQIRGASLNTDSEIREAMHAPSCMSTKRVAKNGCTITNVMNQALWRDNAMQVYGGSKK